LGESKGEEEVLGMEGEGERPNGATNESSENKNDRPVKFVFHSGEEQYVNLPGGTSQFQPCILTALAHTMLPVSPKGDNDQN